MSTSVAEQGVGRKDNYLDILHRQADGPEYKIPIKKIDFRTLRKPTDIDPLPQEKEAISPEEKSGVIFESTVSSQSYKTPNKLIEYINILIKENRPLKGLRWDIEEAKSLDEIVSRLTKTNLLSKEECDEAISCCQYPNKEIKLHVAYTDPHHESTDLTLARKEYVEALVPYLKKLEEKKISYRKLMQGLGAQKDMPLPGEPKELVNARNDYYKARNKDKKSSGQIEKIYDIMEVSNLRQEILALQSERTQIFIDRANKKWEKISRIDNVNVLTALLSDLTFLSYVPPKDENYVGLRPEKINIQEVIEEKPVETKSEVVEEKQEPKADHAIQISNLTFDDKPLQVILNTDAEPQTIQVIFNDNEIASGTLTRKGPSIKVHSRYKAGFLLAKTMEEKAFENANSLIIKNFKI